MKSYTNIEQSKKLAEILPIESADTCYIKHASSNNPDWRFDNDIPPMILGGVSINEITAETLPCWSLAALFGVLPSGYVIVKNYHSLYYVESRGHERSTNIFNNPIDACYEMILKLHELNLL